MPTSSSRNKENLLKSTLKKRLPRSDGAPRVTRSSSQGRSKSFTNAKGYEQSSSENSDSDSDSNKSLPTALNTTKNIKDRSKTKTVKKNESNDIGRRKEKEDEVTKEGKITRESAHKLENVAAEGLMEGLNVVRQDAEQNMMVDDKVNEDTCNKGEVKTSRRKSVLITEDVKINVNETNSQAKRIDARKSMDHASKRKILINKMSNYTREELKEALLKSEDDVTELHMKYKHVRALHGELLAGVTQCDASHRKLLEITHERDELKQKLEFQKFTREDQADMKKKLEEKVSVLEKTNTDVADKNKKLGIEVLHLKKSLDEKDADKCNLAKENEQLKNTKTEMEERIQCLSNQVDELERTRSETLEVGKKKTDEILLLKKCMEEENVKKTDEVQELNQKIKDTCQQVLQLEEEKKQVVDENEANAAQVRLLKQRLEDEDKDKGELLDEKQELAKRLSEVESCKSDVESKVQDLESRLTELEDIKRKLEEENQKLDNDKTESQLMNEDFAVKMQGLLDKIGNIEKINGEIVEENSKINGEMVKENRKLEEELEENRKLEEELKEVKEELKEVKEELKEVKDYQLELEATNGKTRKEYEQLHTLLGITQDTEMDILDSVAPHARKDSAKYFFMQDSLVRWIKNDTDDVQLMSVYKNLILDLQDVMDFYSLLSGISVWKTRCSDTAGEISERKGNFSQYYCQLNPGLLNAAPCSYRFELNVNCDEGIVKYSPDATTSEKLKTFVPKCLQAPTSFNADQAFIFLRNILQNEQQ